MIDGFVDIHSHILPGIDDGPSDLGESLAMARAAVESGISTIVATPHLHPSFPGVHVDQLAGRCDALRDALTREGIPLKVISGGEAALTWAVDASDEQLSLASYGQRGNDLLIETPFTQVFGIDRFVSLLGSKGYRVTLAHPERNHGFQRDESPLRALVDQGLLLQLNAESLLGSGIGRGIQARARQLLRDGLVHVIASDGHRASDWRPVTRLADAVEAAAELVGQERAQWMVSAAPQAIVSGAPLPDPPPIIQQQRKRRRLFGLS